MATRGRGKRVPFDTKAGFRKQQGNESREGVHAQILKQARQSGQLNLSGRGLEAVPDKVWRLNLDVPEEAKNVSLDNSEDRWWEQVDLTKLLLVSNLLTELSEDIVNFPALTVLDVHDNRLESLPQALGQLECLTKLDVSRNKLKTLPLCVCQLKSLVSLHIEHNEVTELCDEIKYLHKLEDLDVSNNQLMTLPRSIGHLSRLLRLNVSQNKLTNLPPDIGCMDGLKYFEATHNQLVRLPDEFGNLRHLEQLYLRHNKLPYLPVLENCVNLKELHVGNNDIKGLTAEHLQHLTTINILDLRDNKIAVLPDEITLLQGLQRLDLTNNDLSGLPYGLGTINSLKSLVLDGNPMKGIRRDIIMRGTMQLKKYLSSRIEEAEPVKQNGSSGLSTGGAGVLGAGDDGVKAHDLHQFKNLDYSNKKVNEVPLDVWEAASKAEVNSVNLSKNTFTQIPDKLTLLSNSLKELNMGFNKLTALNSDIGLFLQLTTLDLRCNALSDLPGEMTSLQNIREVILSNNRFTQVPPVLYQLPKLEILLASDNKIEVIDAASLMKMTMLATLDLQNNNCTQFPPELGNCESIRSLQLAGNPCRNPRPAILAKGTPAVMEYLRSRIVT
ncbi:leucine-rich repeat-containing protein 40-like isoform X1 [Haliotis cracherodii]|uniref:leucine-rich repeat-containing protein 40-like isoform X1 n=1 Tax=Haliotis cracherodii TaxID=6455 RepID=UPI0039EA3DAD